MLRPEFDVDIDADVVDQKLQRPGDGVHSPDPVKDDVDRTLGQKKEIR